MAEQHDPKELQILSAGVDYVFERSDGQECPLCGARMGIGEEANPKALKAHLRSKHPQQCGMAMAQDSLNPVVAEKVDDSSPHSVAGIKLVEDYDRFDALYIPEENRADAAKNGDVFRWTHPDRVTRLKDQGAVVEPMHIGATSTKVQGSTEDNRIRANEMTLMRIPAVLAVKRRQQKSSRVERQLAASKEAHEKSREGIEKLIYDSMKAKGHDSSTAGQVSRAVSSKALREQGDGKFEMGDPNARQGITITNQQGSRSL
jgi:hypothetical protein